MAIIEDPEGHEPAAFDSAGVTFAGLRVLEIGSGDGRLTSQYIHHAASVIAIDPNGDAIARLSARLPTVDARVASFDAFEVPPHSVDVALFAWSL
jgi:16S rRNA A1518/A1519 N6-dimethyltransferase RsmA/KsgA/DIM1 with predicted DNA glycosylase/AP lyase activity